MKAKALVAAAVTALLVYPDLGTAQLAPPNADERARAAAQLKHVCEQKFGKYPRATNTWLRRMHAILTPRAGCVNAGIRSGERWNGHDSWVLTGWTYAWEYYESNSSRRRFLQATGCTLEVLATYDNGRYVFKPQVVYTCDSIASRGRPLITFYIETRDGKE